MCGKEEDRWLSLIIRGMTTLTRAKRTSQIVSFLMVFGITPSELVLMVMNPMMLVTIGYQAIIGHPSVGVDITA